MHDLLESQRAVVADILGGGSGSLALWQPGALPPEDIVALHRQTVFGALTQTLELTFPTLHRLVGADFFGQVARAFIAAHPPTSPILSEYGDGFVAFAGACEHSAHLTYLKDVAAFDLMIDRVANHATYACDARLRLSPEADLVLDRSLRCLAVDYPVDAIREAIEADREDDLAHLDMTPTPRFLVAWLGEDRVRVRHVGEAAYLFLATMDADRDTRALPSMETDDAIHTIQRDVLCAPYSRISTHTPEP